MKRVIFILFAAVSLTACEQAAEIPSSKNEDVLTIREQGSFAVGGSVITAPGTYDPMDPTIDGQTLHTDHASVFYQIPENSRRLPLVFWHGYGQTARTWQTTPDGREGFKPYFYVNNILFI